VARSASDVPVGVESGTRLSVSGQHFLTARVAKFARVCQFVFDLAILAVSFRLAYALRFDFAVPAPAIAQALKQLPVVLLAQILALELAGVYNFIWRYVGMRELKAFVYAFSGSALALAALRFTLPDRFGDFRVPVSVIFIGSLVGLTGVLGLRLLRRFLYESSERQRPRPRVSDGPRVPTLFLGAGESGRVAARELEGREDTDLDVRGFLDDDPAKQGMVLHGLRVLGTTQDLSRIVAELGVQQVVITIAQIKRSEILRLIELCRKVPVKVRIIPGYSEILEGRVKVSRIRDVNVEDLLGRTPVELDRELVNSFIDSKTVMVTGAGGSIGSELARQVSRFHPARILLVERAEFALFDIQQELERSLGCFRGTRVEAIVADVGDEVRMRAVFAEHRPHVVLHAAAHKHVPMMEANPTEAVKNNILATRRVATIAGESGAEAFVLISTDKAVRPTSVMGSSKRVAEIAIQDLTSRYVTRFVAVRFGNVIGSAGSVIPTFREQILQGGPVTVTHAEMRRYFMTIPEAAQLVLQAGAMGNGGEILVLDMGEQVKILELAEEMIRLSGLKPYEEMGIVFTGLRPGEKLYEELEKDGEELSRTRHPKIFIGNISPTPHERVSRALAAFEELARFGTTLDIRLALSDLLPESRLEFPDANVDDDLNVAEATGEAGPHAA
jgi:FlaA1/EpsC-like NDP-sugar epimerase